MHNRGVAELFHLTGTGKMTRSHFGGTQTTHHGSHTKHATKKMNHTWWCTWGRKTEAVMDHGLSGQTYMP